jgi:Protein of unknown function (DUF2470)
MNPFPPEVEAQIVAHINGDHADNLVLIVRALGGMPQATAARMSAAVDGIEVPVRIPFSERLSERSQVQTETVRMYRQACETLGVEPKH